MSEQVGQLSTAEPTPKVGWRPPSSNSRVHPLMQLLREAREPVLLSFHTRGIWVHGLPTGPSSYQFEVRVEHEEWWEPRLYIFKDHARRLASYLAREVRHQWDARK